MKSGRINTTAINHSHLKLICLTIGSLQCLQFNKAFQSRLEYVALKMHEQGEVLVHPSPPLSCHQNSLVFMS